MSSTRGLAPALLGLAVRCLPEAYRRRYRDELSAELHDLPPAGQLRFAAGALLWAFALRAALVPSASGEDDMPRAHVPFWRCRVFRTHKWLRHSTEDGGLYESCAWCGVDRGPAGLGMMTTPPWPGSR